jgi:hypothetical protein
MRRALQLAVACLACAALGYEAVGASGRPNGTVVTFPARRGSIRAAR